MENVQIRFIFPFLFSMLLWSLVSGQSYDAGSFQDLQVDVVYLSSDLLQGRETGTIGEEMAAKYIASRFRDIGLEPGGEAGTFFQPFVFRHIPFPNSDGEALTGKNIVGFIDNGAEQTVIIGAHYDHIGFGSFNSRYVGDPEVHNGADDNASGIAALLWLADHLKKGSASSNNYLFIAFSAEEMGLHGSKHYVEDAAEGLDKVKYMLNLDMVGRLGDEQVLTVNGAGTSPIWKEALEVVKVPGIRSVTSTESGIGPSDHTSFYLKDIPSLHFFTGVHEDYHKPSDDSHLINYDGLLSVSKYVAALVEWLDEQESIGFTKTKDEQPQRAARYKVTLGVMPDYAFSGPGMRIEAVLDGRSAQKAGLQGGDVILKIGQMSVKDIYGYMEALGSYEQGQRADVVIKRNGQQMTKEVIF